MRRGETRGVDVDIAERRAAVLAATAGAERIEPERIASGFSWPEVPRWRDGAFWFSDMYNHVVDRLRPDGAVETVVDATRRRPYAPDAGSERLVDGDVVLGGLG